MLATLASCTLLGIEALPVCVEVECATGLPGYHVVGMATPAVKEGGVRIRAALAQVGHDLPLKKVTVNLAPADVRKQGAAFDLPIALGVLYAEQLYEPALTYDLLILGELGLDGSLRKIRGALAAAMLARSRGYRGVLLPAVSAAEATVVDDLEIHAADHLGEVIDMLCGRRDLRRTAVPAPPRGRVTLDMAEVRGQVAAREAIEIAVAGGHNLLLAGPPGIGHPGYTGREGEVEKDSLVHTAILEIQEPIAETRELWAARYAATAKCACGCGESIVVRPQHRSKGVPRYVHGHHPNPIRRAFDRVRQRGFVMIGEICRELGVSETTYRRLEAGGVVPRARRVEIMKGRFVRVVTASELKGIAIALQGSKKKRAVNRHEM